MVSLISLSERDSWLFVGAYKAHGCKPVSEPTPHYLYDLESNTDLAWLAGRLCVQFKRPSRQSYLLAEKWAEQMLVAEIRTERLQVADFPGYHWAVLTKRQLDIVVEAQAASWKAALSNVGGVYVIADRCTGKQYVGSAAGAGGIWSRWSTYSATGHGHNRELGELLREHGPGYADNFQFGILEVTDTQIGSDDAVAREVHWKRLLLSREYGYNGN